MEKAEKKPLRLYFSGQQAGWIEVVVESQDQRFRESVSYTPNDFLKELITALNLAMNGHEARAQASCEPGAYDFVFSPGADADALSFQIFQYPDGKRGKGKGSQVFFVSGTRIGIARLFWRALKNLEGRVDAEQYNKAMGREFPTQSLRALSNLLGKN